MSISIIFSSTKEGLIGSSGKLPWRIPEDLAFFKKVTSIHNSVCIMGLLTFLSLPKKLDNRINVVISSSSTIENFNSKKSPDNIFRNLKEALTFYEGYNIFLIGGKRILEEGLNYATKVYHGLILGDYKGSPNDSENVYFSLNNIFNNIKWKINIYPEYSINMSKDVIFYIFEKVITNNEEQNYLNLIKEILTDGLLKDNRTGIMTKSVFARKLDFDLSNGFPLLTTRKVFFRGIIEELLFFISGKTDSKILEEKGVNIWSQNTTSKFIKDRGLPYREGDMGPMYGFQWRYSGESYTGCDTDYTNKGIDQLENVIKLIKEDPNSRRIIISSWIPSDLDKMVLNPCHVLVQFYVRDGYLDSVMYQRSADIGLGVPFNIASYALLTMMIAYCTDLKPGIYTHFMADTHIYNSHFEALKIQISREPRKFPKLIIKNNTEKNINSFRVSSFELQDYNPYPSIKMEMAV